MSKFYCWGKKNLPLAEAVICWLTRWLEHTFLEFWWLWGFLHRNKFCNKCLWKYVNRKLCVHDSSQSYKYKNIPWERGCFLNYGTKFNAIRVKQPDDGLVFIFIQFFSIYKIWQRSSQPFKRKAQLENPQWRKIFSVINRVAFNLRSQDFDRVFLFLWLVSFKDCS